VQIMEISGQRRTTMLQDLRRDPRHHWLASSGRLAHHTMKVLVSDPANLS
jgi:hypothetical protein